MKGYFKSMIAGAIVAIAGLVASAPAEAGVHLGVSIGVPGYYYGPGYYPPGPCDAYDYYYDGDCGYSVYDGPIYLNGIYVTGPHYYRWYNGSPVFWYRGGWHSWNGWRNVHRYRWNYDAGWGWNRGHWDRGWGRAHSREIRHDRREYRQDRREKFNDVRELRYDQRHGAGRGELRHDRREIRGDKRELRNDRRDIRQDRHHHH